MKTPNIIFVLGIMPRSGTHFLGNLLCHHDDCIKSPLIEDGLIARSDLLEKYVKRNYNIWKNDDALPAFEIRDILMESLGEGLKLFLQKGKIRELESDILSKIKYIVTKTPQVQNIHYFPTLFPNEKLIIVVRDGRTLTESITKSFNYSFEEAVRDWRTAAQKIISFKENNSDEIYLIVKYESLHHETEDAMKQILHFLELDSKSYDFQSALNIPVVGSSEFKRGEGEVHWAPVEKNQEFKPTERCSKWNRSQHERFNWLAHKESQYFGYELKKFDKHQWYWNNWNRYKDLQYLLRRIKKNIALKILLIFNKKRK